jgi:hypothetical protein
MKKVQENTAFFEGIADFAKTGGPAAYQLGRSIDHRTDTRSITLLPRTVKESGTVVTGLVKWIVTPPNGNGDSYLYDDVGNIYKRTSAGVYSLIHTVPNSHGNGMEYFAEDDFLYYTSDSLVGRYGPLNGTPNFVDDFFGSQGGARTNTNALQLLAASSQYGSKTSTSSLQVAGDLTIEAYINPLSLPTTGNSMVIASKWDTNGNKRGYKFDITTTSNYFGDGSDGALTISADTTEAPIDSACTGTSGALTLSATNASFAANQIILIHQSRGTGAGTWQRNKIISYTAGTITLDSPLNATYITGAQVRVLKQYTNVTINSGKTYTAKAWNGTVGGILVFLASGTVTVTGSINANGNAASGAVGGTGIGFEGGDYGFPNNPGVQGEGTDGPAGTQTINANGNGGGGGAGNSGAGGGGNGTAGSDGEFRSDTGDVVLQSPGYGGSASGATDLTSMTFGGGGGGSWQGNGGAGGAGGGIIFISAATLTVSGSITANGGAGSGLMVRGGGGGGAGGSILLKSQTATLGSGIITANGGAGGAGNYVYLTGRGGAGGAGRVHLDYYSSYTGTTSPTIDALVDQNLGVSDGYVLRLQLSSNGTNSETYSRVFTPVLNTWQQVVVSWVSTTSTATFYKNAVSLGTSTAAFTSISANTAAFAVGCSFGAASAAENFYNGYIDEVRLFSKARSQNEILLGMGDQILSTTAYLKAYYQFNNAATDSTSNANDLTLSGSPTYVTDTPFNGATTRLDIDLSATTAGNTYTLGTTIVESATTKKVFAPTKDPQKSIAVLVAAIGTGDWTLTVHDSFDNTITSKTITNANMAVGYMEFVFSTPWRPLLNQNYHFHLTSTVADGTVTTTTASDLATVSFRTYFQFLVTDTSFHPITTMLQFLVFGNERYLATYEATLYEPNAITMPAGLKTRCFGFWNEYLSIGIWKGSTIKEYDMGRLYFWDGTALTYNFFVDVPEGAVNAMKGTRGKLYFIAGYRAKLMVYEGAAQARKIKNLINTENDTTIEVFPGAMNMWRTLLRIGVAGNADDATVQRGVYTWGSVNDKYPDSLSFDYVISTGNYIGNTITIGCIATVNAKLLISYKDNTSYGVDYVDITNAPYPTGRIEFLIEDDGAMYHQKETVTIGAQFKALNSGESVSLQYRLDRNANWTTAITDSTAGDITLRAPLVSNGIRYREYEVAVDLSTSTTTSPTLLAVSTENEQLESEKRVS